MDGVAGPILNIGGEGQVAIGPWYDVRSVGGDAQHVNIQIRNGNTDNDNLPRCTTQNFIRGTDGILCYNPDGGMLLRVRFRDSLHGSNAFSFSLALGCGEVWAGGVRLGPDGLPEIRSSYPVVVDEVADAWITEDEFLAPQGFVQAVPGDVEDWQRGYFEVIGVESLSCKPEGGVTHIDGDRWLKAGPSFRSAPTNQLAVKTFLVRAAAGISYAYDAPAISRFVSVGGGPVDVPGGLLGNLDAPTLADCISYRGDSLTRLTPGECVGAVNLALATARLSAQFDIDPTTAGETRVVATLPTRNLNCADGEPYGTGPFSCDPEGEEIYCTVSDRSGNADDNPLVPPGGGTPESTCLLPRTASELSIRETFAAPAGDFSLWTWQLPDPSAGSVSLDLARNAEGELLHGEEYPDGILNVFARGVQGYEGLPALGVVVQEFRNGEVGGSYGNTTPASAFQQVLDSEVD